MASASSSSTLFSTTAPAFLCNRNTNATPGLPLLPRRRLTRFNSPNAGTSLVRPVTAVLAEKTALQYRKLGDSDLHISEITLGTMTFGEQNTEKEAHEMLSYSFDHGINILDTAEAYPIPMKKETQGNTDRYIGSWLKSQPRDKVVLATKVCGYSERSSYIRENTKVLRVDAANIKESVEKSLQRLGTDYIDLLQIHWPDRYVPIFGEFFYDYSKWRPSVPFVEQLRAFQELIGEGKQKLKACQRLLVSKTATVCLLGAALKRILLKFATQIITILAYSLTLPWMTFGEQNTEKEAHEMLSYSFDHGINILDTAEAEATIQYVELAKKHGLSPVQLALGFVRDRPFMTSSIIGATSIEQLKEDIDAFLTTERPLPPEVNADIETIFKKYKDPAIL
ncbi:hypothetical protein Tsubulata_001679 [Turnera subulata]|uniref:NADP-dependent oxidoreductase domain-containing protein n=1 Tax=Turnera subulata TaxID=218843 RepID=A0A9Q0FM84_9ROSI|nr:hypothetical protein Tsubulata_001679 [Turnera subulata]